MDVGPPARVVRSRHSPEQRPTGNPEVDPPGAPHAPGVYGMVDRDGELIYVGQSKSLRNRLVSYFAGSAPSKARRIIAHTHRLVWETAPDELAALLRQLELIRQLAATIQRPWAAEPPSPRLSGSRPGTGPARLPGCRAVQCRFGSLRSLAAYAIWSSGCPCAERLLPTARLRAAGANPTGRPAGNVRRRELRALFAVRPRDLPRAVCVGLFECAVRSPCPSGKEFPERN